MADVAIFGAGPNGLLAAYAVDRQGHTPVIYSNSLAPSELDSTMFLARAIPGLTRDSERFTVTVSKTGDREGYAKLLYGTADAECSWDDLPLYLDAYPLDLTYGRLWDAYKFDVITRTITTDLAEDISERYPLTISTLPAEVLCHNGKHTFEGVCTWLMKFERELLGRGRGLMQYNGNPVVGRWFRYSGIRSWHVYEYARHKPPGPERRGWKPISTDCDCLPKVHRVGRFAKATRGVMNHHAYEDTVAIMAAVGLGRSV